MYLGQAKSKIRLKIQDMAILASSELAQVL